MKTKNKLLTDEQLEMIEAVVDYVVLRRNKGDKGTARATIGTALTKWSSYNKMASNFTQGWIGARELRYLIDMPLPIKIKLGQPYKYGGNKYYDIKEAKKIIENHYMRPNVWHSAHTMPSIKSMPLYIYVIDQDNNIERLNMSNCGELSASMPELVWDFLCKMHKIKYWAYPQDILPRDDDERGAADTAL